MIRILRSMVNGYLIYGVDGLISDGIMVCTGFFRTFSQNCGFPIFAKIDRVLPLWVTNGCVKYEFDIHGHWFHSYVKHERPHQKHHIPGI